MERSLLWISFGIGIAGWVCCATPVLLRREADARRLPWPIAAASGALPVAVFLISLLGRPPFTPGCGFGAGFLLGGVSAWMSLAALRAGASLPASPMVGASRMAAAWLPPVAALSFAQLLLRSNLLDTLAGMAIGWFCIAVLVWIAAPRLDDAPPLRADETASVLVLTAVLACAGILGALRGADIAQSLRWAAAASTLAAGAPLVVLIAALPSAALAAWCLRIPGIGLIARLVTSLARGEPARNLLAVGIRAGVAGALILGLARLVELKLLGGPAPLVPMRALGLGALTWCALIGLIGAVLIAWLMAGPDSEAADPGVGMLAALVVVGAFMAAHQLLGGFGCAVALLAGWTLDAARLAATPPEDRTLGARMAQPDLLLFALLLLLYQTIGARFAGDLRGGVRMDHYALFGILLGAGWPPILAARIQRRARPSLELALTTALPILAAPATILLIWGPKCVPAMGIGLALSAALSARNPAQPAAERITSAFLAIGSSLALCQWTGLVMRLAVLTRSDRAQLVIWIAGSVIAVLLASNISAAAAARRKHAARGSAR